MTYLAISTNTGDPRPYLAEESERVEQLVDDGTIERYWVKTDYSGAVLVLRTDDEQVARSSVEALPIARAGLTHFELIAVTQVPPGR